MNKSFYVLLCSFCLGLSFVSCGDRDDDDSSTSLTPILRVESRVGSDVLSEGATYIINETAIKVDLARFYIGNITLLNELDTIVDQDYVIAGESDRSIVLPSVDEDTYDLSFSIGIDPATNGQNTDDFASRPASDPLGAQEPAMHWNWNTGYKFVRIDATVDTDGDGEVDTQVQYHIGSDPYYAILDAPTNVRLTRNDNEITVRFDLAELLSDLDIANGESTHVGDNVPVAQQILQNYTKAFSILN